MDTGLTSDYIHELHAEAQVYKDKITDGSCTTLEDYKNTSGIIKGLKIAEQILHDTIKHALEKQEIDDEDDDDD